MSLPSLPTGSRASRTPATAAMALLTSPVPLTREEMVANPVEAAEIPPASVSDLGALQAVPLPSEASHHDEGVTDWVVLPSPRPAVDGDTPMDEHIQTCWTCGRPGHFGRQCCPAPSLNHLEVRMQSLRSLQSHEWIKCCI